MKLDLEGTIAAGKRLDPDEREVVSLALQHADTEDPGDVDAAWQHEVDGRVAEILSGEADLVDGEETVEAIRVELATRRK